MTPYEQWRDGSLTGLGSFHTALLKAYQLADGGNMKKLEEAFPEWFLHTGENTIMYWMSKLPEPYRSQAMKYESEVWYIDVEDIGEALLGAFKWYLTDEGKYYWDELYDTIK